MSNSLWSCISSFSIFISLFSFILSKHCLMLNSRNQLISFHLFFIENKASWAPNPQRNPKELFLNLGSYIIDKVCLIASCIILSRGLTIVIGRFSCFPFFDNNIRRFGLNIYVPFFSNSLACSNHFLLIPSSVSFPGSSPGLRLPGFDFMRS